jgi:hypothetical protein
LYFVYDYYGKEKKYLYHEPTIFCPRYFPPQPKSIRQFVPPTLKTTRQKSFRQVSANFRFSKKFPPLAELAELILHSAEAFGVHDLGL